MKVSVVKGQLHILEQVSTTTGVICVTYKNNPKVIGMVDLIGEHWFITRTHDKPIYISDSHHTSVESLIDEAEREGYVFHTGVES